MPSPQIEDGHLDLNGGYVRLYRKTLESSVFQNPVTLKVWIWCLLKANHKGQSVSVRTGRGETLVNLQSGQFIFGRNSASKELNLPASTIHDVMVRFRKTGNLTIFPDSHYSTISISKWSDYQAKNPTGNPTDNRQATDTNKNVKKRVACANDESFTRFWDTYPKKVNKAGARKIFVTIFKKLTPEQSDQLLTTILNALKNQKHSGQWQKDNGQYIPHPTTWLRGERWNDDVQIQNSKSVGYGFSNTSDNQKGFGL